MNKLRTIIGLVGAVLLLCCVSSCKMNPEEFNPEILNVEQTDTGFHVEWRLQGASANANLIKKGVNVVIYYSQEGFIDDNGDFNNKLFPNDWEEVIALKADQKVKWEGEVDLPITTKGEYFIWISAENKTRTDRHYGNYVARKIFY